MLGTGAAFVDPDRAQSGTLVTLSNGRNYLFDCGGGITRNMVKADVNPADVPVVFLTHLHHDHICDYPIFAISGWMWGKVGRPIVIGPKGTKHFAASIFKNGMFHTDYTARGHYASRQKNIEATDPDVRECSPGIAYQDEYIKITCDWVEHIPREICECFGVRIEAEGKVIAISGDTSPCEAMVTLAKDADLLVHECTFPEAFIEFRRKTGVGIHAHTSPFELGEIARKAKVKALAATHFGHFETTSTVIKRASVKHMPVDIMGPHLMDDVVNDIRKNYAGALYIAQDLMRIDL
jgi:ribonuclease Z